jgi:hypothetical protein
MAIFTDSSDPKTLHEWDARVANSRTNRRKP